jgi:TonB family protein
VANYSSAKSNWRSAPRPNYPYEARRAKQTGSGKFIITFDDSGNATDVSAAQSTGSPILDQTSINTFMRWKCNPGAYHKVSVPITYTLSGAQL